MNETSERMLREHLTGVLLEKTEAQGAAERTEAVKEFLAVTMTASDDRAAERVAEFVPPLLPELYRKWIGMFVDRLFETVPREALNALCDGADESNAAIVLAYVMFLESERMEKQIDADMKILAAGADENGEMEELAAGYIRTHMLRLTEKSGGEK